MEESSLAVAGKLLCLLPRRPCFASSFISPVHKTRVCEEHKALWCSLTWKPHFLPSILIRLTTDALQRHLYGVTLSLPHEMQFYHSLFPSPYSHTVRKGAVELRAGHSFLWRHLCLLTRTPFVSATDSGLRYGMHTHNILHSSWPVVGVLSKLLPTRKDSSNFEPTVWVQTLSIRARPIFCILHSTTRPESHCKVNRCKSQSGKIS